MITATLILASSMALGALTPAKVGEVSANPSALHNARPPTLIYVEAFSAEQAAPQPEGSGGPLANRPRLFGMLRGGEDNTMIGRHREEQRDETLAKLPATLQKALVSALSKSIAPAKAGTGDEAGGGYYWLITGKFIVVDQGNRALQAGIGFGAGQSQIQVEAEVYTLSDRDAPFLSFDSKGASGHMPGAILMKNPYVAAAKFVMSKKQPDKEAKKVAKSIAEAIGKFMDAQGIPTLKSTAEEPAPAVSSSKRNP